MALSPPCPRPPPHLAEVVPFGPVGGFWPEAEEMQLRCQDLFILGHAGEDEQEPHLLAVSCREPGSNRLGSGARREGGGTALSPLPQPPSPQHPGAPPLLLSKKLRTVLPSRISGFLVTPSALATVLNRSTMYWGGCLK